MNTPLSSIEPGASNILCEPIRHIEEINAAHTIGPHRYELDLELGRRLPMLVCDSESDVLVVSFHGAMVKGKHHLPRFEWLRSLARTRHKTLFFSDPVIGAFPHLSAAWFIGWPEVHLPRLMATIIQHVAHTLEAEIVILLGSSAGGYAALQTSFYVPHSVALPFSPRVSLRRPVSGRLGQQREFMRATLADLDAKLDSGDEDTISRLLGNFGDRASVDDLYQNPSKNSVIYVQNFNDNAYMTSQYLPFVESIGNQGEDPRFNFLGYQGPAKHNPPRREVFYRSLDTAILFSKRASKARPEY